MRAPLRTRRDGQDRPPHHADGGAGYKNPWPSWVKPSAWQLWSGLRWGAEPDPVVTTPDASDVDDEGIDGKGTQDPDFEEDLADSIDWGVPSAADKVKASWLGHAGVLLQLPPLAQGQEPIRVLFDPIWSDRCSPLSFFGPQRHVPPPAPLSVLPPIDFVLISHNHFDHLDLPTLAQLWDQNPDRLRFVLPAGNKDLLLSSSGFEGLTEEHIEELDWWDSVELNAPGKGDADGDSSLTITCTPAQHGSGRTGLDANASLWSSWYLHHETAARHIRAFFAGDTGYQMRAPGEAAPSPECPAFEEIALRLGSPDLSFLPISVGATLGYLKSYDPFPAILSPFPAGVDDGLTGANHMPPRDAVRVFRLMQGASDSDSADGTPAEEPPPVAVAIHWGTFVQHEREGQHSLRKLRAACEEQGVRFARSLRRKPAAPTFVALHSGGSLEMPLRKRSSL